MLPKDGIAKRKPVVLKHRRKVNAAFDCVNPPRPRFCCARKDDELDCEKRDDWGGKGKMKQWDCSRWFFSACFSCLALERCKLDWSVLTIFAAPAKGAKVGEEEEEGEAGKGKQR